MNEFNLEDLLTVACCQYHKDLCKNVYNYITNLQQENERLKEKYDNSKSHEINYKYFTTLYSKATKDIVIDDLVYKCEDLDNLRQSYEKLYIEKEDYKSRCIEAIEIIEKEKENMGYAKYDSCLLLIENILQNGSENK